MKSFVEKFVLFSLFLLCTFQSSPVFAAAQFSDVYPTDELTGELTYLIDRGVVEGYSDYTFRPLNLINRAEFTKMVVSGVLGKKPNAGEFNNCFQDVLSDWYAPYICYAKEEGWVEGYGGGVFKPDDEITRAEAVKITAEAYEWERLDTLEQSTYLDNQDESAWYTDYLLMAEERVLFDDLNVYLSPNELISRRWMAEFLYRAMNYEAGTPVEVRIVTYANMMYQKQSYEDMLRTGIQPAYAPGSHFPANSQSGWSYGCYAFAVKSLLEFKYGMNLNISEVQDRIGWDGSFLWDPTEAGNFAREYDVDLLFGYYAPAEYFFKKLSAGEPIILYIPYYVGSENVGHQIVAYSFDENGVWISDSLQGGINREIPYTDVFVDGANYTLNVTELRQVKSGGEYKMQGY
ncbi:MAG: S-layer homology domain-containing protein [Candidatus Gracilibacteria bacterium]